MDAHLHMATCNQCGEFARKHLGIAACDDNVGVLLCVPVANAFFEMLDFLGLVNQDIVMHARQEPFLNPCVKVIFGFNVFECLFLLVNIDDVGILVVLVTLDEVFHHITFPHTARADDGHNIAFSYPRIYNISVISSCNHFHNMIISRCKDSKKFCFKATKLKIFIILLFMDNKIANYLTSSKAPVSESMINPRITMSLGTRGWVLMVSTVLRTDVHKFR